MRVKSGGMCWTITTGAASEAGRRLKISASALGPPVEQPTARTLGRCVSPEGDAVEALRGGEPFHARHGSWREHAELWDELRSDLFERGFTAGRAARLRHVVRRAQGEGVEGGGGAALGERAEHDHRELRRPLADLGQELEAAHVGHLDVQPDHVGRERPAILLSAIEAVDAVPTTSMSCSEERTSWSRRRTSAESSTMRTRTRLMAVSPSPGRAGAASRAARRRRRASSRTRSRPRRARAAPETTPSRWSPS